MPNEGIESVSDREVERLRQSVSDAIDDTVARLRGIEVETQRLLREAGTEQQHLNRFLEEVQYRLSTINSSPERPVTITGPLTDSQVQAIESQQGAMSAEKERLEKVNASLEQLSNRLSWLVHQIDGACAWVLSSNESAEAENAAGTENGAMASRGLQPSAGEQVMWAQMVMGQEAERARLAREIHDGPAQVLANTVMRLSLVEKMFVHSPGEVQSELERVRAALQESVQDVRRFIFNLRPASLSEIGLLPTLSQYTRDYSEQFNIPVELSVPENLNLSTNQELVVFRIIQEALQNIHKHAEATSVAIDIQQRPGGPLTLTITDNGRGFDHKSVRTASPSSSGLVGMRERAATVGGTLKVDSRSGIGTTVTLVLPKVS
ncbi:MAG: two-component system, NarL family, sensor histidine kinase DegS [Chloroflexia bacterium]|jgi:two-component system sensor histidine kinase DegS|nr:two-component system, NarL family, sensor histidine kinase DegS [Chloroflexia bacterium]